MDSPLNRKCAYILKYEQNEPSHSIVWKIFEPDTVVGKKLLAEKDFGLPYLIEGVVKEEFENDQLKGFQQFQLLLGILVGFHDLPPSMQIIPDRSKILFDYYVDLYTLEMIRTG